MAQLGAPIPWHALHLAKRGHGADEYEDAFAADSEAGRFAVADAASECSFGALWARLLVEGFIRGMPRAVQTADWLRPLQERWAAEVDGRPLPWYAEMKRDQGAFATVLGLVVRSSPKKGRVWRAVAVGDSCLFQVRGDRVLTAFPVKRAQDFDSQPDLLGSRPLSPAAPNPNLRRRRGRWQPGDQFLLMTDALACWFLQQTETGHRPWETIAGLLAEPSAERAFAAWVQERAAREGLRNDDVTLIAVGV
jgi:hypothetical protein